MKLNKFICLSGEMEVVTGLHIGTGKSAMGIGGVDTPVVRDLHTGLPIIPGSSLKGKLRTMIEWQWGLSGNDGRPFLEDSLAKLAPDKRQYGENVLKIFGGLPKNDSLPLGPGRLKVADLHVVKREGKLATNDCFEEKIEIAINRERGSTQNGSLRTTERVVPGTTFGLNLTFRVFEGDNVEQLLGSVLTALRLAALDGLGGSTSRGYGRMKFANLTMREITPQANGSVFEKDLHNETDWKDKLSALLHIGTI